MEFIKKMGPKAILLSLPFIAGGFFYKPLFAVAAFLWYAAAVSFYAFRSQTNNAQRPAPTPVKRVKTVSPKSDRLEKLLAVTGKILMQVITFIGRNMVRTLSFVWKHAKVLLAELFVWVWQNKTLSWLIGSGVTLFVAIAISWWGLSFASFLSTIAAGITMAKQWGQVGGLVWKIVCKFPVLTLALFFFSVSVIGLEFKNETMAFIGMGISVLLAFFGVMSMLKKPTDKAHEAIEKKFFSKEK